MMGAAVKQKATAEGNKRYWDLVHKVLMLTYKVQDVWTQCMCTGNLYVKLTE